MKRLALAGLVLSATVAIAAQDAPGTARIHGRAVAADSGIGLAGAQVSLEISGVTAGQSRQATADINGLFDFRDIPPGRYVLRATRAGYVATRYGRRREATHIVVAARQTVGPLAVSLPRAAVISGTVVDASGEPIIRAMVRAQRYQYGVDGNRVLADAGVRDTTDDLGRFRVHGLPAGDFIVAATVSGATVPAGVTPFEGSGVQAYYPATVNAAEAQVVPLAAGAEASVQISMVEGRMSRVGGTVTRTDGTTPLGMRASIRPEGSDGATRPVVGVLSNGMFTLSAVPPGNYLIDVRGGGPSVAPEAGSVAVTVAGEELVWPDISTVPGATVRGRVVVEGASPLPAGFRVIVEPARSGMALIDDTRAQGAVRSDSSFEIAGVLGRVVFATNQTAWHVISAALEGEELAGGALDVTGRGIVSGLTLTVSSRQTTVRGRIADEQGRALGGHVVVLLQADSLAGMRPRVRAVVSDQDGRFQSIGLRPGVYVAGAVDDMDIGDEYAPGFQERLRANGRGFVLGDGGSAVLDLTPTVGLP
jgi:protocatechuate 3,4-dioxygenase beta subunit